MTQLQSLLRRPRRWLASGCVAAALLGCASGSAVHDEGMNLVVAGQRDAGLAKLREAAYTDPTNAQFRIDFLREQLLYARDLLERADEARRTNKADEARAFYEQALRVQPGNERAMRGLVVLQMDARHAGLLVDADRALKSGNAEAARAAIKSVLAENPSNEEALRMSNALADQQAKIDQAKAAQAAAQSILRKPVTLQFRDANLRMVFEALSRTTGLNVILDRDVRADLKTTIFVKDATVEDTVDMILLQNQLDKRTLNASTLFIYPATPAKQKEYQDLQVRTFQLANTDAKYIQTVLKSLLKIKEVSMDERTNSLAIRDTPEAVAVAAKVIAAHDVPEPEVMLEVEVLEISRNRASNIGLQLPTAFSVATPISANTIGALKALTRNDLTASGVAATLNLQLQDTDANLLASPRIRARNKEKARILIGDRVPTITNAVTPIQTGGSVVTGSVQYQDVGLKLEFEPQVYNNNEVGIKLSLEVSNIVATFTDPQGGRSYQIGTRNAQTSLRLRDGETQVLGGLISELDRNAAAKVPGLGQLPVAGALFSNNDNSRAKTEIILSITPRIVRAPANIDASLREIFSGTETSVRERALRLDPVGDLRVPAVQRTTPAPAPAPARTPAPAPAPAPAAPATTGAAPPASPAAGTPVAPVMAAASASTGTTPSQPPPGPSQRIAAAPVPGAPPAAAPTDAPAVQASGPTGELTWQGPTEVKVGESFKVTLSAAALPALRSLPVTVRYDPSVLRYDGAVLGSSAEQAGATAPPPAAGAVRGRVEVPLNFASAEGLAADGPLLELTFTVHAGRATTQLIAAQSEAVALDGTSRVVLPGPRTLALRITK